jgi:hypothetical protein
MRALTFATLFCGLLAVPSAAYAQMGANRSLGDKCQAEAETLYRGLRNLEERMKMKRDHIRKCRAAQGGRR